MGKGTKHAREWKETTLQVVIDAKRLYTHSVKIMGNEKVFRPANDFRNETLMRIHGEILDVYMKTWDANRINCVKDPSRTSERLALQRFAIASCHRLLALFELAKSQFHLESRKFWHWMEMLVALGKKLEAWHKSDEKRFGAQEDGGRLDLLGQRSAEVS